MLHSSKGSSQCHYIDLTASPKSAWKIEATCSQVCPWLHQVRKRLLRFTWEAPLVHHRRPQQSTVLFFYWVSTTTRWVTGLHFMVTVGEKYLPIRITTTFSGTWWMDKMDVRGLVSVTADFFSCFHSGKRAMEHSAIIPQGVEGTVFNFLFFFFSDPLWLHLHSPKCTQLTWNMKDSCTCCKYLPVLCQGLGNWTRLPTSCLPVFLLTLMAFSWGFHLRLPLLVLTSIFVLFL